MRPRRRNNCGLQAKVYWCHRHRAACVHKQSAGCMVPPRLRGRVQYSAPLELCLLHSWDLPDVPQHAARRYEPPADPHKRICFRSEVNLVTSTSDPPQPSQRGSELHKDISSHLGNLPQYEDQESVASSLRLRIAASYFDVTLVSPLMSRPECRQTCAQPRKQPVAFPAPTGADQRHNCAQPYRDLLTGQGHARSLRTINIMHDIRDAPGSLQTLNHVSRRGQSGC